MRCPNDLLSACERIERTNLLERFKVAAAVPTGKEPKPAERTPSDNTPLDGASAHVWEKLKYLRESGEGLTSRGGGPAIMVFRCATFSSISFSLSCSRPSCGAASGSSSPPVHGILSYVNSAQYHKQISVIPVSDPLRDSLPKSSEVAS